MHYEANKEPKRVTYWLALLKDNALETKISAEHQKSCWANVDDAVKMTKFSEIEKMLYAAEEFISKKI